MNPFEIVDTIRATKKYAIGTEISEKDYPAFMVNRTLSYRRDCIGYAQVMNINAHLDNRLQYDYLFNSIRQNRSKERTKWGKKEKNADLEAIMEYYGFGYKKAIDAQKILTPDQIKYIRSKLYRG